LKGIHLIERDYSHPAKPLSDAEDDDPTLARSGAFMRRLGGVVRRRREKGGSSTGGEETELSDSVGKTAATAAENEFSASFTPLHRVRTSRSVGSASIGQLAGAAYAAAPDETPSHLSAASSSPHDPNGNPRTRRGSNSRGQLRQQLAERERLRTIVGSPAASIVGDDNEITAVGTERGEDGLAGMRTMSAVSRGEDSIGGKSALRVSTGEEAAQQEKERPLWLRILVGVKNFVSSLATPPTISLITALVVALVDRLKAVRHPLSFLLLLPLDFPLS
jgi:hypothetical protein